jgi:hypothetical protein
MTKKLANLASMKNITGQDRERVQPALRDREQRRHRWACRAYNRALRRYALRLELLDA